MQISSNTKRVLVFSIPVIVNKTVLNKQYLSEILIRASKSNESRASYDAFYLLLATFK